jgi:AcrR family transcriptional regulator
MEEVARRAGVGVGTVYRRFPSKEHLFVAVSHAACSATHECVKQAAESQPQPLQKLRAIIVTQCQHSDQLAALLDHQSLSSEHPYIQRVEQQALYEALHHMFRHVIIEGQKQGVVRQGDPDVLAAFCLQLVHPRAVQQVRQTVGCSTEDMAEQVVHFLMYGLKS